MLTEPLLAYVGHSQRKIKCLQNRSLLMGLELARSLYTHKKNQMLTEPLLAYGKKIGVSPLLVHSQEKSNAYRTAPCLWDWS